MTDEAKLGLVAGVLAVVGVAVFGQQPKEPPKKEPAKPALLVGSATAPPSMPPAAVSPAP